KAPEFLGEKSHLDTLGFSRQEIKPLLKVPDGLLAVALAPPVETNFAMDSREALFLSQPLIKKEGRLPRFQGGFWLPSSALSVGQLLQDIGLQHGRVILLFDGLQSAAVAADSILIRVDHPRPIPEAQEIL